MTQVTRYEGTLIFTGDADTMPVFPWALQEEGQEENETPRDIFTLINKVLQGLHGAPARQEVQDGSYRVVHDSSAEFLVEYNYGNGGLVVLSKPKEYHILSITAQLWGISRRLSGRAVVLEINSSSFFLAAAMQEEAA